MEGIMRIEKVLLDVGIKKISQMFKINWKTCISYLFQHSFFLFVFQTEVV